MMTVPCEVRPSSVEGRGLFLLEPVEAGEIMGICPVFAEDQSDVRYGIVSETEYLRRCKKDPVFARSGGRLVGDYYGWRNRADLPEDFINHSDTPNMLFHCGVYFALRRIEPGEELLCDYRFIFPANDDCWIGDQKLRCLSGKESLLLSARMLVRLLEGAS